MTPSAALQESYRWVEDDPELDAVSVTFVRPADGAWRGVLAPRERWPDDLTVSGALDAALRLEDFAWGSVIVQEDELGGWDVIIEPNGWAASMPEALVRLSAAGTAVSTFWNVNAVMSFSVARSGIVVRTFDPLLYAAETGRLKEEDDFEWGVGAPRAASLALLERLTGVRLTRDWFLDRRHATYAVPLTHS